MRHANRDADHLNSLRQYFAQNRRIPSYQRIADLLGFASRAAAVKFMGRMEAEGFVARTVDDDAWMPARRFFEHPLAQATVQAGQPTVAIPIRIQRYSGRRQVVVPQGISAALNGQRAPTALQVALARGHRWLRQIEGGQARNLAEIADREKIDRSYVSRMVNLTTLAPSIQAAILDETLPEEVVLFDLAIDTPLCWQAQRQRVADVVAKVRAGKTQPAAQT